MLKSPSIEGHAVCAVLAFVGKLLDIIDGWCRKFQRILWLHLPRLLLSWRYFPSACLRWPPAGCFGCSLLWLRWLLADAVVYLTHTRAPFRRSVVSKTPSNKQPSQNLHNTMQTNVSMDINMTQISNIHARTAIWTRRHFVKPCLKQLPSYGKVGIEQHNCSLGGIEQLRKGTI